MAAHDVEYLRRIAGHTITVASAQTDRAIDRLCFQGLARAKPLKWVDGRPRVKVILTPAGRQALQQTGVL